MGETENELIELRKANRERDFSCVGGQIRFRMEECFLTLSLASHVMLHGLRVLMPSNPLHITLGKGREAPRCIPSGAERRAPSGASDAAEALSAWRA